MNIVGWLIAGWITSALLLMLLVVREWKWREKHTACTKANEELFQVAAYERRTKDKYRDTKDQLQKDNKHLKACHAVLVVINERRKEDEQNKILVRNKSGEIAKLKRENKFLDKTITAAINKLEA